MNKYKKYKREVKNTLKEYTILVNTLSLKQIRQLKKYEQATKKREIAIKGYLND